MPDRGTAYRVPPDETRRVVDESLFRYLVEFEIPKAHRLQYPISVVYLSADLSASEASRLSAEAILDVILKYTRATDAITSIHNGSFGVLLIDADTQVLSPIIRRLTNEVTTVTRAAMGENRSVTWSGGGACYPKTAQTALELLGQAFNLMSKAQNDGGDRFYVAS
jgi:hypothetical protein